MAVSIGNEIPEAIRPLLNGDAPETNDGLTFLLLTTTVDHWPHVAMLSVGEILATRPRDLRLALWPTSTATANLTRSGQATLALVHAGAGYSLRCSANRRADVTVDEISQFACFRLRVEEALLDVAPYAELTSGVRFRLKNPADVLPRWCRQLDALRRAID